MLMAGTGGARHWSLVIAIILLAVISAVLLIALIAVATKDNSSGNKETQHTCSKESSLDTASEDDSASPSVFQDLTMIEIAGLKRYLYSQSSLDLVKPTANKTNKNFVFIAELHLPNKSDVLNHLDHDGPQPNREARVVIIRGKGPNQGISELVVGPLPDPTYHKPVPGINESLPYLYRPMIEDEDYGSIIQFLTDKVHQVFGEIIYTCFGAKLKDCGDQCILFLFNSPFSPASSGTKERKMWYWLNYHIEYYTLHHVDFAVLSWSKPSGVTIDKVWFLGKQYDNLEMARNAFDTHLVQCTPQSFPKISKQLFSTLHRRGQTTTIKRAPVFVEPDGKRYMVKGKHVEYMQWSFDFRMSTSYGPVVHDIRFDRQRVVYELGLQEVSVFYSGHSPQQRFSDYMDSGELIGPSAQGLVPGVDCPSSATFFDTMHVTESSETQYVFRNVFCLFEQNTGEPLRRHHSYSAWGGRFFEGMENVILVLRTILTVANYDYVLDFKFYQNGMIETKAISTGCVLGNAFTELEKKYGYQIQDKITANFHTHLFNFKVDLDVNGVHNTYEVIKIEPETEPNEFSSIANSTYSQAVLVHEQIKTEKEAAYKFDFSKPKYHIFYNQNDKNKYDNPRAYRLINTGMVKQILPEGENSEPAIKWARYQFAVTKRKDHEAQSSSMYSMFDTLDPVVDFQSFIDDNENILNEDLVVWVTVGVHHIPHTEDLPVTTTAGMGVSFYLQPYNYFTEDPAMASPNAVRIEPRGSGVFVERYNMSTDASLTCVPQKNDYEDLINSDKSILFDD